MQLCIGGYILNEYLDKCIPKPGFWVPFPTLGLLLVMIILLYFAARCCPTKPPTRIAPTLIAYLSLVELPLFVAQAFYAAQIGHEVTLILTILGIVLHFPVNWRAANSIVPEYLFQHDDTLGHSQITKDEQGLDLAYKHWANEHRRFLKCLRNVALYYNHKILRLITSDFRGKP